jgi:PAS domain S-box-containing protein
LEIGLMKTSPDRISLNRLIVTIPALVSILIIAVMGCFLAIHEYITFRNESVRMRDEYQSMRKDLLKNQVNQAIDYIDYSRSNTEKRLKESIQARVEEAHAIASHIYREHIVNKNKADVINLILDALRPIRFNQGRGYYFATGLDGVEILFADHPELEGKNLLDMQDTKGAYVIRDMIEIVRRDGQGFYQYTWTKPNATGRQFTKIAYIKYIEPLDGFIGAGEYLDDAAQDIQKEVLERIGKIRFGKDGYIFVVSYDGVTLMNGIQPELIGRNLWDMTDANGVKVIQEERRAADNPEGDFIRYLWQKPSTGRPAPKMSFVKGIPDWQWMVGAGLYMDDIESEIQKKQISVRNDVIRELSGIGGIACAFLVLISIVAAFFAKHLQKEFDAFFSFFKNMEDQRTPVDLKDLRHKEFFLLAESANNMLTLRNQAEESLKEIQERYRALFDRSLDCVYIHDFEGNFIDANESALKLLGYDKDEIRDVNFVSVVSEDQLPRVLEEAKKFIEAGRQKRPAELTLKHRNGQPVHVEVAASIIHKSGKPYAVLGIARDLTGRKQMEEQLIRSQRLESVGRLAGGVAHDFNNMLSVIIGYAEMAIDELEPGHRLRADIQEILSSAKRSADLTRQLLAFARRQPLEMAPLDMNQIIQGFMKLLRRTLRENIAIETRFAQSLDPIYADIGQIEQVIIKLAVNAQDAMPHGGKLTIETSGIVLENDPSGKDVDVLPGPYVQVKISDTGIGMRQEVMERIFEPFFTTKSLDRGSGLGLSVIYGIVKQHQGHITVESEPGKGTAFSLYFPVRKETETITMPDSQCPEQIEGTETILLVEDEDQVREMIGKILRQYGYTVMEVSSGAAALDIASKTPNAVDLLVTDVIMPGMNGKELYQALRKPHPGLKPLFISGYTENIMGDEGWMEDQAAFIQKPFEVTEFVKKVRIVLNSKTP